MMIPRDAREAYWKVLTAAAYPKPCGVTSRRLEKVKPTIMADDFFWQDVIGRHGAMRFQPDRFLQEQEAAVVEHCLGNFWGMVVQTMLDTGLIKP